MARKPTLSTKQAQQINALMLKLEQDILADATRRIAKAGKVTSTADWQIGKLTLLGYGSSDIEQKIRTATGLSQSAMATLYANAAQETYTRDASLYTATGRQQVPYDRNLELQQLVRGIVAQTNGDISNLTHSTGFMTKGANGRLQFTPLSDIYNGYLDENITAMLSGAFDYNAMIRKTVTELTNSGLRTVDYASGRSVRVDVAVRSALLTGYGQITSQITFSNAAQLGTELFEVTWHPDARPTHQTWQGKVYTRRELEDICGYGSVGGLCGANCRHSFYPFVEGVSKRQWTDGQLAALNAQENAKKEFGGKWYTDYEASQRMRTMETNMRAIRERIALLEEQGVDVTLDRAKLRAITEQYKLLCDAFGQYPQWERVRVAPYMLPKTGATPGGTIIPVPTPKTPKPKPKVPATPKPKTPSLNADQKKYLKAFGYTLQNAPNDYREWRYNLIMSGNVDELNKLLYDTLGLPHSGSKEDYVLKIWYDALLAGKPLPTKGTILHELIAAGVIDTKPTFAGTTGITDKFRTGLAAAVNGSPYETVRAIYAKYEGRLACINDKNRKGAYYDPTNGGIFFNANKDAKGTHHEPYGTACHEFGHMIDNLMVTMSKYGYRSSDYRTSDGRSMKKVMEDDYSEFKRKRQLKDDGEAIAAVRKICATKGNFTRASGDASDALEWLTGKAYPLGIGHGLKYWKSGGMPQAKEFFTEVLAAAAVNQEALDVLRTIFPTATQAVFDIIEEDLKK